MIGTVQGTVEDCNLSQWCEIMQPALRIAFSEPHVEGNVFHEARIQIPLFRQRVRSGASCLL